MPPRRGTPLATRFQPHKVLYWGYPGTGKTTCLASLARLGDVKYIAADESVRKPALERLGVPIDPIEIVEEIDPIALDLEWCWSWQEQLAQGEKFSVTMDTATELVARRIEAQVDEEWASVVEAAQAVNAELTKEEIKKRYFVNRDYYGVETQEMRRLLRHMRDLKCHVAWSAQVRRDVDLNSGDVTYGPDVNPAIQGDLMANANQVIELALDGEFFIGYTRPTSAPNIRLRKDRDGLLPRILANPTMDRVIAYLDGGLNKDNDPEQAKYRAHKTPKRAS